MSELVLGEERESCRVCGMWIDQYQHTAVELVYIDGKVEHTCGVACMLRIVSEQGPSSFRSIRITDWNSKEAFDAASAWYSVGSAKIPDMLPNYIAFSDRQVAEAFSEKEGGRIIDFTEALEMTSPRGMTQPFRIRQAVTSGAGSFGVGMVYSYMLKDRVLSGTDSMDPELFIGSNPAQPRAPKRMDVQMQSLVVNYALTDRIGLNANLPYFEKEMDTLVRQGKQIVTSTSKDDGIGDMAFEFRYNPWRSTIYDKFFTLLAGVTLPTGSFDGNRTYNAMTKTSLVSTAPGVQMGTGVVTYMGGLLYSQRIRSFWLHAQALYRYYPENGDNYRFGNEAQAGLAVHYTPNYDVVVGIEMDAAHTDRNEDRGMEIGNTGGTRANIALIGDWRMMNLMGGNFNLRGTVGIPIYEDLNSQDFINTNGQPYTQVQLGGGVFATVMLSFNTRFGDM